MDREHQEILKKVLTQPYPLPPALSGLIAQKCRIEQLKKKQMITESGQTDMCEYFLLDGIIHRYVLAEKGEFITTDFYMGPTLIMPHFARSSKGKSIFSLQALTPVTIASIPVETLDRLKESHREIREWAQKIVEHKLKRIFVEEIRFRSKNARERLDNLREEFPNIENEIPHTCIASYVGITPRFLFQASQRTDPFLLT